MDRTSLRVASRYLTAQEDEAFEALTDHWVDEFLDEFVQHTRITDREIEQVLKDQGITYQALNDLAEEGHKEAAGFFRALGGLIFRGVWNLVVHPFLVVGKLIRSSKFRQEIKIAFKRALRHEVRATKHMFVVAEKLARGEEVNSQERKAALMQFVDVMTKALLIYFAGPHIAALFAKGFWRALGSLLTPLDEILAAVLDKPIRAAARKMFSTDLGLLPSGFYTHFER
jgi:hypothetical protein